MRPNLAACVLAVALLIGAQPALAATERGHNGQVGRHWLHDSPASPGVRCVYAHHESPEGSFVQLVAVEVRPPVMFAAQLDTGHTVSVGWRARLRGQVGKPWATVAVRPIARGSASTTTPAAFLPQRFDVTSPSLQETAWLRVIVDMVWYSRDGQQVVGGAATAVDHYAAVDRHGNHVAVVDSVCQWGYN